MKKIKSLTELVQILEQKEDVYQEINGKMYVISFILVLQTRLIDLIPKINDGTLYYNPEC